MAALVAEDFTFANVRRAVTGTMFLRKTECWPDCFAVKWWRGEASPLPNNSRSYLAKLVPIARDARTSA